MCLEDVRIGRSTGYALKTLGSTGGQDLLCPPNSKRTRITIGWQPTVAPAVSDSCATVAPKQLTPAFGTGFCLYSAVSAFGAFAGGAPTNPMFVTFTIEEMGLAVCDAWYGFDNTGASGQWTVMENFFEDDASPQYSPPNRMIGAKHG